MKTLSTLLIFLLLSHLSLSQVNLEELILKYDLQSPVISLINLKTGAIESKASLKEPPVQVAYLNKEDKAVYAMTKHYLYKIDALSGEVLIEFKYQETLIKKSSDPIDPNMFLMPLWFGNDGIGFYFNMNEQIQASLNGEHPYTSLFRINTNKRSKDVFTKIDVEMYEDFTIENYKLYLMENNLGEFSSVTINVSNIENYEIIQKLKVPIDFTNNEFDLSADKIYRSTIRKIDDENVTLLLNPKYELYPTGTIFSYTYNLVDKKAIALEKFKPLEPEQYQKVESENSNFEYQAEVVCEKPDMPKEPVYVGPIKNNRKGRAEAKKINAQKLKEYQKKLDEWTKAVGDNSNCIYNLYKIVDGEKVLIKELLGVRGAEVYYDRYIYYYDGLEYVMFDLEMDVIIWSLN